MQKSQSQLLIRALIGALVVVVFLLWALPNGMQLTLKKDNEKFSILIRTPLHLKNPANIITLVERLKINGVQRVWVQVKQDETDEYLAGSVFYPSKLAPIAQDYEDDRLGLFIRELAANGIEPLAWMPTLHDRQAGIANPGWRSLTIDEQGKTTVEEDWLCPFYPEVAEYQAAIAREVLTRYPEFQGLYLDFIRYDNDFACACPSCFAELEVKTRWRERVGQPLKGIDLRRAAQQSDSLWNAWIDLRAEKIVDTVNIIRDSVESVRPDFHIGAFVLPFSSKSYVLNTQAGQDLYRLARAGLDELVLMGYWDDWDHSPEWLVNSINTASDLVAGEAKLSLILDGDMSVRRTRLTLEALGNWAGKPGWFHYGEWSDQEFSRLTRAITGFKEQGVMPKPKELAVVIRVDTEPDYQPSYDAVHPEMIETLLELFRKENIKVTFVTTAKLAVLQTDVLHRAVKEGHEIASHAFDHEQIDALDTAKQIIVVDSSIETMRKLGFDIVGFGAPRNSITDVSRDRLMEWNLEYDGSIAYDPLKSLLDVHYVRHSEDKNARILVIPFIIPNDWDARYVAKMTADEMLQAWKKRLEQVYRSGEPVFVLDIHQWLASRPENLVAVHDFIRYVKSQPDFQFVTLRTAAKQARVILDRYEPAMPTSGDQNPPLPAPEVLPETLLKIVK